MAAEKDDPGVLGNLPRSRPGQRSAKRSSGAGGARKQPAAGSTAKRGSTQARASATSKRSTRSTASSAASKRTPRTATPKTTPPRSTTPPRESDGSDPLTQAVRLGGKVAETGVKTAIGILRRVTGR